MFSIASDLSDGLGLFRDLNLVVRRKPRTLLKD
jgi:hypothetical protein